MSELTEQEIDFIGECLWDSYLALVMQISNAAKTNNNEKMDESVKKIEFAKSIIDKLNRMRTKRNGCLFTRAAKGAFVIITAKCKKRLKMSDK